MEYSIEEQPSHVFLTATQNNRKYILETTDTEYGFLRDIKNNRRYYAPDTIDDSRIFKEIGEYSHLKDGQIIVKGSVSLKELAGLNYYNSAIGYINASNFEKAVVQLQKAYYLYPSERIKEATKYCILKVMENPEVGTDLKVKYHQTLLNLTYSYSFIEN